MVAASSCIAGFGGLENERHSFIGRILSCHSPEIVQRTQWRRRILKSSREGDSIFVDAGFDRHLNISDQFDERLDHFVKLVRRASQSLTKMSLAEDRNKGKGAIVLDGQSIANEGWKSIRDFVPNHAIMQRRQNVGFMRKLGLRDLHFGGLSSIQVA